MNASNIIAISPQQGLFAAATLQEALLRAPTPIAVLQLGAQVVSLSDGWREVALDAEALFASAAPSDMQGAIAACAATGDRQACRLEAKTAAGPRWFMFDVSPWPNDGGPARQIIVAARDIHEIVEAARAAEAARNALARQNSLFDAALDNVPHGICMFDADDRLILCNGAYRRLYGLPEDLCGAGTALAAILAHRANAGSGPVEGLMRYIALGGAIAKGQTLTRDVALLDGRTIRINHSALAEGGYVATHEDITPALEAAARIEYLAFRDTLTGLPNRAAFQRAFDDAVAAAENQGEIFGVVMLDVDHFKDINDTLGHDAGDVLLKDLARQLSQSFRRTDTVCRLGGDEFAIVLRHISGPDDMLRPIAALQEMMGLPVCHAGQSFSISASLGAALHDDPDADPRHLLKNADVALYAAKSSGRSRCVVFEPAMRTQVEQRVELLREVRMAIAQGEFDLFYQPVVDIRDNTVAGFEALMRWNHPEQGVLPPAAFLAAFDDNDLSLQLGEVAFERALGQMRAWLDRGVAFGRVAINVSSSQFRNGRLARDIADKLARWRVPPDRLTIEVTENVYMGWGADIVSQTVRELHETGVLIALDDFGTGYASLANLRQFPIDRLKIDKSFVQNIEDDAIVRAVINLGSSLGMKVVAEGVEHPAQLAALSDYGCDHVQGYHFSRPMPADQVADFVAAFMAGR